MTSCHSQCYIPKVLDCFICSEEENSSKVSIWPWSIEAIANAERNSSEMIVWQIEAMSTYDYIYCVHKHTYPSHWMCVLQTASNLPWVCDTNTRAASDISFFVCVPLSISFGCKVETSLLKTWVVLQRVIQQNFTLHKSPGCRNVRINGKQWAKFSWQSINLFSFLGEVFHRKLSLCHVHRENVWYKPAIA